MLTRVAMTVMIVIMCLAAMSITAYAYFSYNITSGSNIIKSASFYTDVTVQVAAEDGTAVDTITTNTSDHKSHSAELSANKTYTITVKHNDRSTAQTGFVIVTAEGCETKYHTQQLGRDGDGNTYTITFKLTPGANTVVTFRSHWGTSTYYGYAGDSDNNIEEYILDGEDIELVISGLKPNKVSAQSEDTTDKSEESTITPSTSTNTTTGTETPSTQTSGSTTTPSTETSTPVETTPPETTGTSEPTSTTEPTTQTTESASTESTTETQSVTENSETTGTTTTEANE
ncbi:MAG: hypothetical protein J6A00_09945 [Bacteroides sp.]|nr:hypothetical protein [Bacteroides sp.]